MANGDGDSDDEPIMSTQPVCLAVCKTAVCLVCELFDLFALPQSKHLRRPLTYEVTLKGGSTRVVPASDLTYVKPLPRIPPVLGDSYTMTTYWPISIHMQPQAASAAPATVEKLYPGLYAPRSLPRRALCGQGMKTATRRECHGHY